MNRRTFTTMAPAGLAFLLRSESGTATELPSAGPARYMQWTGYHWVEIVDGVITNVHTGDEWVELSNMSLNVNDIERGIGSRRA